MTLTRICGLMASQGTPARIPCGSRSRVGGRLASGVTPRAAAIIRLAAAWRERARQRDRCR
jgi:hypothetical protein